MFPSKCICISKNQALVTPSFPIIPWATSKATGIPCSTLPVSTASRSHHDNPLEARQEVATQTCLWKASLTDPLSLSPSFFSSSPRSLLLPLICCFIQISPSFEPSVPHWSVLCTVYLLFIRACCLYFNCFCVVFSNWLDILFFCLHDW